MLTIEECECILDYLRKQITMKQAYGDRLREEMDKHFSILPANAEEAKDKASKHFKDYATETEKLAQDIQEISNLICMIIRSYQADLNKV